MAKPQSAGRVWDGPWLSSLLLVIAYATYSGYLRSLGASASRWGVSVAFVLMVAAIMTLGWGWCRQLIIFIFKTNLAFILLALILATLAMVAVSQFRVFAYLVLLVTASLLARVDLLIAKVDNVIAFLSLTLLSLLGLGLAWLPHLIQATAQAPLG